MSKLQASEAGYESIRRAIIEGEFREGDRLVEADLAARAGVSRTPIREALRRLASEGFVQVKAGSGAVVSRWTRSEVAELVEIRAALESLGAGLAARSSRSEDVARLSAMCDEMENVAEVGGASFLETFSVLNTGFHVRILEMSESPRLAEMAKGLMKLGVIVRTYSSFDTARIARSLGDHRSLVSALKAGSVTRAEATMRSHVLSSLDSFEFKSASTTSRNGLPDSRSQP